MIEEIEENENEEIAMGDEAALRVQQHLRNGKGFFLFCIFLLQDFN